MHKHRVLFPVELVEIGEGLAIKVEEVHLAEGVVQASPDRD